MTQLLWLRATPLPYETPISNASRNAVLNHQTHGVGAFCKDLGLDLRGLQDGKETAIAQLAHMVGVSPLAYYSGVLRLEGKEFSLRGEQLPQTSVRRKFLHVCPICISKDIANSALPPAASAYCRSHWLLDSIRSCPQHELELVELQPGGRTAIHDFSVHIAPHLDALEALPRKHASRTEFRFQTYLHDRLDKRAGTPGFLDRLDFDVAARLCEMLGAALTIREGQKLSSLSNRDWLSIGEEGFAYACLGPEGVSSALSEIQRKFTYSDGRNIGLQAIYGQFFRWVSANCGDTSYNAVSNILREHIIATMPIRTGETVLGKVVAGRQKLHSVRTASFETGFPPRLLRKILHVLGHLRAEDAHQPNSRALFDAEQNAGLLDEIRDSMPLSVASEYLGAGRTHGKLLFKWGFIQPFVRKTPENKMKEHQFTKRELDDFLTRFLDGASSVEPSHDRKLASLPVAAKQARCSSMEIVELIFNRQLPTLKRSPGATGFLSLLVDIDEVRSKVRGKYAGDVTARKASTLMRVRQTAVHALMKEGVLASRIVKSPTNFLSARIIPIASIEEFNRTYCTLAAISRSASIGPSRTNRILVENGINPALPKEKFVVSFYLRTEIARIEFK